MTEHAPTDDALAVWYDVLNPWGPDNDFYLGLVLAADAVLDVGCGTGVLLQRAREAGHTGRLCGLDPSPAMLRRARRRTGPGIEWLAADAASAGAPEVVGTGPGAGFDLVVMTGHAFQVLTDDAAVRATLAAIRSALRDGGRFVFETRNPLVRPWERWTPDHAVTATGPGGRTVRVSHQVELPVTGDLVRFSETFEGPEWPAARVDRAVLRFLGAAGLSERLAEAGLAVEARYGDWDRRPFGPESPEIITVARRAPGPAGACSGRPGA
ncbi:MULTISPECIES: class I SAM-dependent methyltransferase [unclassified Streptomyces]|uniref:class I SAM-dependent DNA methyltransferase n=1 Tax=unclassified Streptomyces TaxID=2593676 RepID=UPI00037FEF03|nr:MULTISPECIES: class I SAM-dependent methyltransferase [unclassified Streptomyces]MYT27445.1 methyltransferase domain-containing protein [Streptomyces sp. SID8354]